MDFIVFVSLGSIAALVFLKYRNSRMVMVLALLGLAYAASRYLDLLVP
jgi:uncharacterized membrane protein YcaP (DUF421 family)